MRRILVIFGTSLLLWTILAELNHAIAPWRVHFFAGALFVAHSALTQPTRPGLLASMLAGLVFDATTPVIFGTHLLLFAGAHLILVHVRDRVPREDTTAAIIVVLLTNFGLFLLLSFGQVRSAPSPAAAWPRLFVDLACSQILLALITPWFLALQSRALVLGRVQREEAA